MILGAIGFAAGNVLLFVVLGLTQTGLAGLWPGATSGGGADLLAATLLVVNIAALTCLTFIRPWMALGALVLTAAMLAVVLAIQAFVASICSGCSNWNKY